jgi:hypothetical protein
MTRRQAAQAAFEFFIQSQMRVGDLVIAEDCLGLIEGFNRSGVQVLLGTGQHKTFAPQLLIAVPCVKDGDVTANFAGVRFMDPKEIGKVKKHGKKQVRKAGLSD